MWAHMVCVAEESSDVCPHGLYCRGEFRYTPAWFVLFRLKRSSSQDFDGGRDHVDGGEFRRGGVRATATARLAGWSQRTKL